MTGAVKPVWEGSKSDNARERELFRYYQPIESTLESSSKSRQSREAHGKTTLSIDAATSPDTTLTALAQLCALRLRSSRAMIR